MWQTIAMYVTEIHFVVYGLKFVLLQPPISVLHGIRQVLVDLSRGLLKVQRRSNASWYYKDNILLDWARRSVEAEAT